MCFVRTVLIFIYYLNFKASASSFLIYITTFLLFDLTFSLRVDLLLLDIYTILYKLGNSKYNFNLYWGQLVFS